MPGSVTYLENSYFRAEINVVFKACCRTALGRAFRATFLAAFLARLLTTLLTTLTPEARKSNPRTKKVENALPHVTFLARFLATILASLLTTLLTTLSPQARKGNPKKKTRECTYKEHTDSSHARGLMLQAMQHFKKEMQQVLRTPRFDSSSADPTF